MKRLSARCLIDDTLDYGLESVIAIESSSKSLRLSPRIEITRPADRPITMSGNIVYKGLKKSNLDISIDNVFAEPITISGENICIHTNACTKFTYKHTQTQ